jgi:hypothetical protein
MLVTKYAVAADRLQPHGGGPYSPLASNHSEDGRAVNRRVELVRNSKVGHGRKPRGGWSACGAGWHPAADW